MQAKNCAVSKGHGHLSHAAVRLWVAIVAGASAKLNLENNAGSESGLGYGSICDQASTLLSLIA